MSNIGKRMVRFDSSPQFDPFSKIIVKRSDTEEYVAGDDTGRALTIECPWGTQRIADGLLLQIQGYAYQPFTATGALVSPAAELGDGIIANGLESRIYAQEIAFGPMGASDISAPDGEEIDHEYPYLPSQDRKSQREISNIKTTQQTQYTSLDERVLALEEFLKNVTKMTASVAAPDGSTLAVNYLGWEESTENG